MLNDRHLKFWPANSAWHMSAPQTNLFYNAEVSAKRYPDKPYLIFYDTAITFGDFAHRWSLNQVLCDSMF